MITTSLQDIDLFQFSRLAERPGLAHAMIGKGWNMAPHRGPEAKRAVERRKAVCAHLGISFDRLTAPEQVHGAEVLAIDPSEIGAGRNGRADAVGFVDGLMTDRADVGVAILSADCPVVLVYDEMTRAIGAVHASWRGTVAGIARHLVQSMVKQYGCDPGQMVAGICPSAGPCCYEIGPEVARIVAHRFDRPERYLPVRNGQTMLDLWQANFDQLTEQGLRPEKIERADLCTICDDRFFSHRREGKTTGRNALIAGIRP
jgi:YfiH family protein